VPKDKAKKTKPQQTERDAAAPVYTFVDTGVPRQGLSIWGYRTREDAIARARQHYERQAELIQAVLLALEENRVAVRYTQDGHSIPASTAAEAQRGTNNANEKVGARA
jgi:hypothetical protein